MVGFNEFGSGLAACMTGLAIALAMIQPAAAFCVRNDTGSPIMIEAVDGTAVFNQALANNKKVCCSPKDAACEIDGTKIKLSISSPDGASACSVAVTAKGHVNVTGRPDQLTCKANKAGSTMDWASG
jgi:hypothetical protein